MGTKIILSGVALAVIAGAYGQKPTIEMSFTAINNAAYVQLDSIKVINRSQGSESIIYYPDTTLSLEITPGDTLLYVGYSAGSPVGIQEIFRENKSFHLNQNFPNPVKDQCMISVYMPADGLVSIIVNDIQGRILVSREKHLEKGMHYFRFSPGNSSIYLFSAYWKRLKQSIKIINEEPWSGKKCLLDYAGSGSNQHSLKSSLLEKDLVMLESGILDVPVTNESYTFQFATNIPCPGNPTVTYEGQVYNTIQIFSQCWLKENLNVGTLIPGTQDMSNNNMIEKYCYDNEPDSCTKYGGLYQWYEMMQYSAQQGLQGICPTGWHLPTDDDWQVLVGAVDSQYGIGEHPWDNYDAGTNLKTTSGWDQNGNGTDLFGFSGQPGGARGSGSFYLVGRFGHWWTSTEYSFNSWEAWFRRLQDVYPTVYRHYYLWGEKHQGYSVRCLRDY